MRKSFCSCEPVDFLGALFNFEPHTIHILEKIIRRVPCSMIKCVIAESVHHVLAGRITRTDGRALQSVDFFTIFLHNLESSSGVPWRNLTSVKLPPVTCCVTNGHVTDGWNSDEEGSAV